VPHPFSVFATAGPLKVTINGGTQFVVDAGSQPPEFQPGAATAAAGQAFKVATPAPNVFGIGANQLAVIGPSDDPYPATFTVHAPSPLYVNDGDSVQLYLILHDNQVMLSWMVLVNGIFFSYGHSWDNIYESSATTVG